MAGREERLEELRREEEKNKLKKEKETITQREYQIVRRAIKQVRDKREMEMAAGDEMPQGPRIKLAELEKVVLRSYEERSEKFKDAIQKSLSPAEKTLFDEDYLIEDGVQMTGYLELYAAVTGVKYSVLAGSVNLSLNKIETYMNKEYGELYYFLRLPLFKDNDDGKDEIDDITDTPEDIYGALTAYYEDGEPDPEDDDWDETEGLTPRPGDDPDTPAEDLNSAPEVQQLYYDPIRRVVTDKCPAAVNINAPESNESGTSGGFPKEAEGDLATDEEVEQLLTYYESRHPEDKTSAKYKSLTEEVNARRERNRKEREYEQVAKNNNVTTDELVRLDYLEERAPVITGFDPGKNNNRDLYVKIKELCEAHDLPEEIVFPLLKISLEYVRCGSTSPILLCGRAGIGKTYFGKLLAEILGLGFYKIDAQSAATGRGLTGDSATYKQSRFGEIAQACLVTDSLNPVILIDEIDKASARRDSVHNIQDELLSAMDGSHQITDNFLNRNFDVKGVIFILTANEEDRMAPWLKDRCDIVEFPEPTRDRCLSIMSKMMLKEMKSPVYEGRLKVPGKVISEVTERMYDRGVRSLRQYNKAVRSGALAAYREYLEDKSGVRDFITVSPDHFDKAIEEAIVREEIEAERHKIGFKV